MFGKKWLRNTDGIKTPCINMIKYIRLASDLHMEGFAGRHFDEFVEPDERDSQSVLCLVGDVSSNTAQLADAVHAACARFAHVLFVPGNHEYYGNVYQTWRDDLLREFDLRGGFPANFKSCFSNVTGAKIAGIEFIMGTLWGDCEGGNPVSKLAVLTGFNDCKHIQLKSGAGFSPDVMVAEHARHKRVLSFALGAITGSPVVVLSHYLPSYKLIHPKFEKSPLNGGFASHSDDLFTGDKAPALWLFGHSHATVDTRIGGTHFVSNPRGYSWEFVRGETQYLPKFIEVSSL